MGTKPFAALVEAASACVQSDRERLRQALRSVPAARLYSCAVHHKCAGLLLHGIAALRIHDSDLGELTGLLRRYAAAAMLDAQSVRTQLQMILEILDARDIPHVLLKGSARLLACDAITEWTHTFDIDVLVPRERAEHAASALIEHGYQYQYGDATIAGYRRFHQHLAPLLPPDAGKPVELHVALSMRAAFSLPCDWEALRIHFEPVYGSPRVLRLDAFGRVLHMAMHGAGLNRLGDAVQIALELRRDPALYRRLFALANEETIQRVPLLGMLAAGAYLAGQEAATLPDVRHYLEWAVVREDLPKFCRGRMQLVDAWFANGGALRGPAMHLALPPMQRYDGTATGIFERTRTMAGRVVAGLAGAVLAKNLSRRVLTQAR